MTTNRDPRRNAHPNDSLENTIGQIFDSRHSSWIDYARATEAEVLRWVAQAPKGTRRAVDWITREEVTTP